MTTATVVNAQFSFIDVIRNGDAREGIAIDGLNTPSHVVISPDNKFLYVAGAGDNAIAIFERDTITGMLTFIETVKDGVNGVDGLAGVREIAISDDGKYLYAVADVDDAISVFSRTLESGKLTHEQTLTDGVNGVDGLGGARALAISPDGDNVYVAAFQEGAISIFSVNSGDGSLLYVDAIYNGENGATKLNTPNSVIVSPDNLHVYVTDSIGDGICVFSRDNNDQGRLNNIENINNWGGLGDGAGNVRPKDIIISNDGKNIYVSGYGGSYAGNITRFSRDQNSGYLKNPEERFTDEYASFATLFDFQLLAKFGRRTSLAINPDNSMIFTTGDNTDGDDHKISWFFLESGTGKLNSENYGGISNGDLNNNILEEPKAITFSNDGNFFYVVATEEHALTTFSLLFPDITSFSPTSGTRGTVVTIQGEDFGPTKNEVKFGNVIAQIISWSNTEIIAQVPQQNAGDVNISVTIKGLSDYTHTSSEKFTVIDSSPKIEEFTPERGKPGTTITINGINFGTDGDERKVFFGDTEATDTIWISSNSVSVNVPEMVDDTIKIRIIVNDEEGISSSDFIVDNTPPEGSITYDDEDGKVKPGETIIITASFEEPLSEDMPVQIALAGANTVAEATMERVTANQYTYEYTVGNGNGDVTVSFISGQDLAGHVIVETPSEGSTFTVDNESPSVTFTPENGASGVEVDLNIKIQFSEVVTTLENQIIDNGYVDDLVEMRDNDDNIISFENEYDANEITLKPSPSLSYSTTYQVYFLDSLQDVVGYVLHYDTLEFTTKSDTDGPVATLTFSDTTVHMGQLITITATFDEPVADTPAMKIGFKVGQQNESFTMTKVSNTVYTYEYEVGDGDEIIIQLFEGTDVHGNVVEATPENGTIFIDNSPPNPTFSPGDKEANVPLESNITIYFDEAVRNIDDSNITDEDVQQIFELTKILKDREESVSFGGSYNENDSTITINPESLEPDEVYQVKINDSAIEDYADNTVKEKGIRFTTGQYNSLSLTPNTVLLDQVNSGTLTITVNDTKLIKTAKIYVRGIQSCDDWGDPINFDTETSPIQYTFDPLDDAIGIEYKYVFSDKFGDESIDSSFIYKEFENGINVIAHSGQTKSAYQIISFPLDLENKKVLQVFSELGEYDTENWRLFTVDSQGEFIEYSGFQEIEVGKGYLLIFKDADITSINSGKGKTVEANQYDFYKIPVHPGWNLIGNPFNFDISWDAIIDSQNEAESITPQEIRDYSENWPVSNKLSRNGGNLVFIHDNISSINIPVICNDIEAPSGGRIKEEVIVKNQWEIPLSLTNKNDSSKQTLAGFGMHPAANLSRDIHDVMSVPHFGNYLDISFQHPEYFYPNFAKDVVPIQDSHIWEFNVATNIGEEVLTLAWNAKDFPSDGKDIFLMDVKENKIVNMRTKDAYSFIPNNHEFKIFYGTKAFIDKHLKPVSVSLSVGYPNPFTEKIAIPFAIPPSENEYWVNIIIYDISGKQVSHIFNKKVKPGFYEISWDGKNSDGNRLQNGVYLCELVAQEGKNVYKKQQRILLRHN